LRRHFWFILIASMSAEGRYSRGTYVWQRKVQEERLRSLMNFESLFITEKEPFKGKSERDKFLSRVFGIFSERIVEIWCQNPKAPFSNIGRPTIYYDEEGNYCTLDFLLKDEKGELFVTEMKCEIEYQRYKFFTLSDPE